MDLKAKMSKGLLKETETKSCLDWTSEYSKMTIELLSESQELSFSYKDLFEPISWELAISFEELKKLDKKWSRFHDLEELFDILYFYNEKKALKVTREDNGIKVSLQGEFFGKNIVFDFLLKPDERRDVKSIMADFGKVIYEQQLDLRDLRDVKKKYDELEKSLKKKYDELEKGFIQEKVDLAKEIQEHIEKFQKMIDEIIMGKVPEIIDEKLKNITESMNKAKEDVQNLMKVSGDQQKLIKDADEKNEKKFAEQQKDFKKFMAAIEKRHKELEETISMLFGEDDQAEKSEHLSEKKQLKELLPKSKVEKPEFSKGHLSEDDLEEPIEQYPEERFRLSIPKKKAKDIKKVKKQLKELLAKYKVEKPEFFKMTFYQGSFSGTATSWTTLGNAQTLAIKEKKTLKWTLELKSLYSNTKSFFTKLRIYMTGPQSIYFPGDSNGFLHEWGTYTYNQATSKRETGFLELASPGTYTIYLQYCNSNGNYLYVKDPTLYLETISQKTHFTKLPFYDGQLNATNTSMANMGNTVTLHVPKAKSSYQWILELKSAYSNSYNFYHRVNLYFDGPQSFHIPDASQNGFLHEWYNPGYSTPGNVRETGIVEFEKEGTYTVYLQMQSSNGNYFYFNDPTLYLHRIDRD